MYWHPMMVWADWFTTTLAIGSWAVVAYLVFHVLNDVFGADAGNRDDWTQEGSDGGGPAARHVGRATTSVHRP